VLGGLLQAADEVVLGGPLAGHGLLEGTLAGLVATGAFLCPALATGLPPALPTAFASRLAVGLAAARRTVFTRGGGLCRLDTGEAFGAFADGPLGGGDLAEALETSALALLGIAQDAPLLGDEAFEFADSGVEVAEDVVAVEDLVGLAFLAPLLVDEALDLFLPLIELLDAFVDFVELVILAREHFHQADEVVNDVTLDVAGLIQPALVQEGNDVGHAFLDKGFLGLTEGLEEAGGLLGLVFLQGVGQPVELAFQFLHHPADAVLADAQGRPGRPIGFLGGPGGRSLGRWNLGRFGGARGQRTHEHQGQDQDGRRPKRHAFHGRSPDFSSSSKIERTRRWYSRMVCSLTSFWARSTSRSNVTASW